MAKRILTAHLPPHPIEASEAFKVFVSRPGLRDADSLQRSLTRFFREMAPVKLDTVTVVELNDALERLSALGYDASYVDKLFRQVSAFFQWCRNLGYIDSNPCKATCAPRVDTVFIPSVLEKEDVAALHKHILERGVVEEIILWGALRMGARISEPCMAQIKDALPPGRTLDDFLVDPKVIFRTKTTARLAKMPRFAIPAFRKLLEAKQDDPEAPLLYLKGTPLFVPNRKNGTMEENKEARTLVARTWLMNMQKEVFGEYRWTPKEMRSNFISREIMADSSKAMAVAMQCGNSIKVIQSNYLNYFNTPEFASGED